MKSIGSCCSRIGLTSCGAPGSLRLFRSCGISSPLHTRTRMAWKCLRTTGSRVGSSSLSSSTGSESARGAFHISIVRTACSVSAYVGSTSSDIGSPICHRAPGAGGGRGGAFLRLCTFSTMDGWSAGDLVLNRFPKNLSHRWRTSLLSRSRLPFSSLMACCPSVFLPPRPAVIFRCLYRPSMSVLSTLPWCVWYCTVGVPPAFCPAPPRAQLSLLAVRTTQACVGSVSPPGVPHASPRE